MYNGKTFLAIIPARGGSKRLPNKNILLLSGKPMLLWTVESAMQSKYLDEIILSTDSDDIIKVVENYKIKTIKRPIELASDTAKTVDVVKHIIENIDKKYDFIVLLQPTSPLRTSNHIDEAIEQLIKLNADAIISVTEVDHSPLWCNILPESLSMENFISEDIKHKRSQDLPKFYRLNGAIYICKTKKLIEENTFFLKKNIYAYIMDKKSSIDIDEELDFKLAEIILKEKFLK
ncbi:acylneuraminate cytidylyltransferase family protein [Sulfurihydrogenibium yellowstonense]|uniref:N-acylneuraminate cytidylyltransferase n=1 Tax=Sulfurihydrogenibium yellowstonense SS-5 TaxID=432331 RepID=C4FID4_9AQUI|nr:acylneuraminate cytidylyltransferase family protein [Sulfurihydrogenibium yellowstonense]EEP61152.1 N-acylneuraminate cytidylyltransferase [Sulfurihydrogenibium yellowstonense SS-5]